MSWFSISVLNPFKSQQSDKENSSEQEGTIGEEAKTSDIKGVKDLSEFGRTIGRQLRGVASFLAPPSAAAGDCADSSLQTLLGIRNDFAEIGGSFKSGLSFISTNMAVSEISRLASSVLQFQKEDDGVKDECDLLREDSGGGIFGITGEVLEFVRKISMQPQCWIEFPISLDYDFDMSHTQREHTATVESLAPSLVALRNRLFPNYLNERLFWMIYFVLLHPRLNEQDLKLLSTPQIVEARDMLMQKLQNGKSMQMSSKTDESFTDMSKGTNIKEDYIPGQEKKVQAETLDAAQKVDIDEHETVEHWLEDVDAETGTSFDDKRQLVNEEDVSFSDLEDNDNYVSDGLLGSRTVQEPNSSDEWIQLSKNNTQDGWSKAVIPSCEKGSESEESNDWLAVDDFDSDSLGIAQVDGYSKM